MRHRTETQGVDREPVGAEVEQSGESARSPPGAQEHNGFGATGHDCDEHDGNREQREQPADVPDGASRRPHADTVDDGVGGYRRAGRERISDRTPANSGIETAARHQAHDSGRNEQHPGDAPRTESFAGECRRTEGDEQRRRASSEGIGMREVSDSVGFDEEEEVEIVQRGGKHQVLPALGGNRRAQDDQDRRERRGQARDHRHRHQAIAVDLDQGVPQCVHERRGKDDYGDYGIHVDIDRIIVSSSSRARIRTIAASHSG